MEISTYFFLTSAWGRNSRWHFLEFLLRRSFSQWIGWC